MKHYALLLCAALASTAQASFLEVRFQGIVTASQDPNGEYFEKGTGDNTLVGQEVTGTSYIDLALSSYGYFDDYPWQGQYSTEGLGLSRSFISSSFSIGGQSFTLMNEPLSDEAVEIYNGPAFEPDQEIFDFWSFRDEFNNVPMFSWILDLSISDRSNDLLHSLALNQEFTWFDTDFGDAERSGVGQFSIEQNGFGGATFLLNALSVKVVERPATVPESGTLSLVLIGMLLTVRRDRPWRRTAACITEGSPARSSCT